MKNLPQNPQAFYELQNEIKLHGKPQNENGFSYPDWISDVKETPAISLLMWLVYLFHEKYKDKVTVEHTASHDEEYDFFIKKIGLMLFVHLVPEVCKSGFVAYHHRDTIPPLVYLASNEYMSDTDTLAYINEEKHPNSFRVNDLLGSKELYKILSKISDRLPKTFIVSNRSIDWGDLALIETIKSRGIKVNTCAHNLTKLQSDAYIPREKLLGLFLMTNHYFCQSWGARFISHFDKIKEFYYTNHYGLDIKFLNVSKNCRIKASLRDADKRTEFFDVCFDPERCIGYQNLQTSVLVYTLNGILEWNTRLPEVSSEICNRLDDFIRKHQHKHQSFKKHLDQK